MARRAADRPAAADDSGPRDRRRLPHALGLTLASALVWGVAHLTAGRRLAGGLLLGLYLTLLVTGGVLVVGFRQELLEIAVQPQWLSRIAAGVLVFGLVWIAVIVRSYLVVRPGGLRFAPRTAGALAVAVLCLAVAVPVSWTVRNTYVYRDTLTSIFGDEGGRPIDREDPWAGRDRVNVLLLGGDAAGNRVGVRTDSMTLASIDTRTGDTVLLSLPRNLESFPMPPGPARNRFPYGFTGDGAMTPGLLNEVYQYAEDHPDMVPGKTKNRRGPALIKGTIGEILGQPVDYYILVDMFGFADIIDAMGGVRVKIEQPIPYGLQGQVIQAGDRTLGGKEALWYGRSRNNSDDYVRMGRQKCLLRAIAQQADPQRVLTQFERLATATKRAISTDIPADLLPALVDLSGKVRSGGRITSLQFVPPLIYTGNPDFALIRRLTAQAISAGERRTPERNAAATVSPAPRTPVPAGTGSRSPQPAKAVSLDDTCPS